MNSKSLKVPIWSALLFTSVLAFLVGNSCKQSDPNATAEQQQQSFMALLDTMAKSGVEDYEKANEIRKYLGDRLHRGEPDNDLSRSYDRLAYDSLTAFECLAAIQSGQVSGNCRLSSYLLARLYTIAGLDSYIINCGFPGTQFTHQFNLVNINRILVVQDAHYNMTVNEIGGSPIDFIQLLSEVKNNNFQKIRTQENKLKKGLRTVYFTQIAERRLKKMMPLLKKEQHLPEHFLSIYLKPILVMNANTGKVDSDLQASIAEAARYQTR